MRPCLAHRLRFAGLLALVLTPLGGAGGCADPRPVEGTRRCESWKGEVGALVSSNCASCHGGSKPAGGYDLTSYLGLIAPAPDGMRRAVAGKADSKILTALDPTTATAPHQNLDAVRARLTDWVVECRLAYGDSPVHPAGILDPEQAAEFHGGLVRDVAYDFAVCAKCHGQDFRGGTSGASCLTCHSDGPTACTTCHAGVPAQGAHKTHLAGGALGKMYKCTECHQTPLVYTDAGHIFLDGGKLDPAPVEVKLGELAARALPGRMRAGPPQFTRATGECANVYCHGGYAVDANAKVPAPKWTQGATAAACGACHGLPPASHQSASTPCESCHTGISVNGEMLAVADTQRHLDGKVDIGDGLFSGCSACHGNADNAAPPRDISGRMETSAVTVGAHQAHLRGAHRLSAPIACGECHVVPKDVASPGHIDSTLPAEVFPTGFSPLLATADGATPAWDRANARCANVYCHGGGKLLAADKAPGIKRTPLWTGTSAEAGCGSCHGVPPLDSLHDPALKLTDCVKCHAGTVDAFGAIVLTGAQGAETSKHINGAVDVQTK